MPHSLRPASTRSPAGRATIALAALLIGGCSDSIGPDAGTSARQRWARNRPAHYSFTLARGCFCVDEVVRPVVVEVRDGVVQTRTYAATGEAVGAQWASSFPSIDGLLAELDDAARRADRMEATYDREYGYPQHAYIDYVARAADDEMQFTVSNFKPL